MPFNRHAGELFRRLCRYDHGVDGTRHRFQLNFRSKVTLPPATSRGAPGCKRENRCVRRSSSAGGEEKLWAQSRSTSSVASVFPISHAHRRIIISREYVSVDWCLRIHKVDELNLSISSFIERYSLCGRCQAFFWLGGFLAGVSLWYGFCA
jgi:hypothetical protein